MALRRALVDDLATEAAVMSSTSESQKRERRSLRYRVLARMARWLGLVADCPNEPHESGMVYDSATDDAVCPICGRHESIEQGSL